MKFLIIGAGRISLSHLPHFATNDDVQVIGIVEPNFFSRFIIQRICNIKAFKSLQNLDHSNYDSVLILTPPASHFSLSRELLLKGKNVFVEKPMTLDPKQSKELLRIAEEKKTSLVCGYVYRHNPIFKKVKELIHKDIYGKILSSKISMLGNVRNSNSAKSWRDNGKGSGCLYDYGCHAIDLSLFLHGDPISYSCTKKECIFNDDVIDKFEGYLTFANSSGQEYSSLISCNWSDETARKAELVIEILFENHKIWSNGRIIKIKDMKSSIEESIKIYDLNTDTKYFLRGEDFAFQSENFISNSRNMIKDYSDIRDAVKCDEIIEKYMKEAI